jgi:hypothetical protein
MDRLFLGQAEQLGLTKYVIAVTNYGRRNVTVATFFMSICGANSAD